MVYNWILVEMLTWKITHSIIKPPKVVCQLKKSHIQLFWLITKHSDAWQITHGWMTLRLGLMSLLQVHGMIIFQLQLQVERQKMNVGHSYILCQHLNCKCYFVNITTTIVPCSTNIGMHGSSFFLKQLLRFSKRTKPQWWKYVPSLWKTPIVRFWKLSN